MDNFVIEDNILKGAEIPINADRKLGQLIYDALNKSPDHVAQIDAETGEQTTIREMKDRSVRCAVWMKKLGITPQDIVVVVTHNHLDSYIPVFATFFVDAIFNPWNPNITLHTAQRFMKKFQPKLIFTCEKAADVLMEAAKLENSSVELVVFGKHSDVQSLNDILNNQTAEEVSNFQVVNEKKTEDVVAIMLSSGSTGFPKGVMLSKRTLLPPERQKYSSPNLKLLWYSTIDWITGIEYVIETVSIGNTRIIASHPDAESFFQTVEKYKVNIALIPPVLVSHLVKFEFARNYDLRSFKHFVIGGHRYTEQILKDLKRKVPTGIINQGYGSTETGVISLTKPKMKHTHSTGFAAANCQVKIVDCLTHETLGPNHNGEVCVKTPQMMIGYYGDPEATSRAFDEEGWYRTGDIGYYNEDGEIFVVDRIKEIVKYRNYQISPAEIEEVLLSHPQVQEAAVVAVSHDEDGDWPTAFVEKTPGSRVTEEELMELTSVLEDCKRIRGGIYFIDKLPRTGSGKIAKNELKILSKSLMNNKRFH